MSDYAEVADKSDGLPKKSYTDILEEARERFAHVSDVDKENRDNQKSDTKFVYTPGEQWPAEVKTQRKDWKEPCLEFNQLKQFVSQVVNDQRQNRPGIRIHPASGDASKEVAEILQGMIRAIEYESKADAAYDNGFQGAVVGGRGWWRVCSEFVGESGFDQRLVIKPIADPLTVYADLDYQEPDGSDRSFVFVVEPIKKKEFSRRWPKAKQIDWDKVDKNWIIDNDNIFVADYYRRVCETKTIYRLKDGREGFREELGKFEDSDVARSREAETYRCEWLKIAGGEQVLEEYEWPGSIIPVICCVGEEIMLDGRRIYQGLTRHARDAQSMLNFGMTQQAVHLALTPRAPWKAPARAIKGYEQIWKDANVKNFSVLPYNDFDSDGQIQPPERTPPSTPDVGWQQWSQSMLGMVRSTIGMYENSLGMKGQETSGRAIMQREKQGDNATFNFADNLARAIALTGRIIVEVIPDYYDSERIVHTVGIDDTRKAVTINQLAPAIVGEALTAIRHNDVCTGDYAVTVQTGPSYSTKRQETAQALLALVKEIPQVAQGAPDLVVKSLDIADADALAERLKMLLPPPIQQAIQAKEKGGKAPDPQAMAKINELQTHLDKAAETMDVMHKKIQELQSGAQQKMQAAQFDAQVRESIAKTESDAAIAKAQADANASFHIEKMKAEKDIERAHIEAGVAIERARIERMTKIEIQEMGDRTKLEIAHAGNETKEEIAEHQHETAKEVAAMNPAEPEKAES